MDLQELYDADYGWKTIATQEAEDCPNSTVFRKRTTNRQVRAKRF